MNSSRKTSTNWLSAIGYRLSAIGYRLSAIGYRPFLTIQIVFSLALSVWSLNIAAQTTSKQYASTEQVFEEAEKGDLQSMNTVGNIYKSGLANRTKSHVEAMRWFQKAADAGYGPSLFNVGFLYEKGGDGIPINLPMAAKNYMKAVDAGFIGKAIERLNIVCENSSKDAKAVDCQRFGKYQAKREAQERREAADREASTRQACSRLYIGKPVSWPEGRTCVLTGCDNFTLHGQIVGVGNGVASAKVTESYKYGQVHEKACNEF